MSDAPINKKKDIKNQDKNHVVHTNIIPADLRGKIIGTTGVMKKEPYKIINEIFYKEDQTFITACEKVNIKPTRRQASKWRNQKGLAYLKGRF